MRIPSFVLCKNCYEETPSHFISCDNCGWMLRAELMARDRRDIAMTEYRWAGLWDAFSWRSQLSERRVAMIQTRYMRNIPLWLRILTAVKGYEPVSYLESVQKQRIARGKLMRMQRFSDSDAFTWMFMRGYIERTEDLNDKYYEDAIREGNDGK